MNGFFRNNTLEEAWPSSPYHPHYVMSSTEYLNALAQNSSKELILKIPLSLFILKLTPGSILRLTPSFIYVSDNPTHTQEGAPNIFLSSTQTYIFPFNFWRKEKRKEKRWKKTMDPEKDINRGMLFIMIGRFLLAQSDRLMFYFDWADITLPNIILTIQLFNQNEMTFLSRWSLAESVITWQIITLLL